MAKADLVKQILDGGFSDLDETSLTEMKVPELQAIIDANTETVPDDFVKIKAFKNHKCEINKVSYKLEKGKTYEVPEFVAIVLERGNVA